MAKKYSLEQFPKNKDVDVSKLNEYQIIIRNNKKKYMYNDEKTCTKCFKKLPISEFYVKKKDTGYRNPSCRDCQMKQMGVIEIGKIRFADKIEDKGFRRCSVCKNIKPLGEFKKNKGQKNGISNNCYECGHKAHHKFLQKQKNEIGDFYVKQYCLKNYNYTPRTEDDIEKYRIEIKEKREPKHFLDGKAFLTIAEVARYIEDIYGNPKTMTEKRICEGRTLEECKLSEFNMRSKAKTLGKIRITDTVTNEVFIFINTKDKNISKMFGLSTITEGVKTGLPIGGKRSKYKNPCIIERI